MKKILLFFLIFFVFFTNTTFAKEKPEVMAQGAILMDFETGRVLWGKDEHKPLAMASTTKIMTAILAIENGNLDDIVTVSKNATKAPPVKMFLKEGEKIKLSELLHALMMQSSNDSAVAIAEHISGDVATFCNEMTKKAMEIGAKDTIFRTPNGLDALDHHSTAYDMAMIARYALKNETFLKIINKRQISFTTNKSTYDIVNKNRLLSEFEGANGVKTGFTGKAGHCFVGSAKRGDMTLISVVLASGWGANGKAQKWIDTKKLLNYGFDNFKYEKILSKNDCTKILKVKKGEKNTIPLCFERDIFMPICSDEKGKISIKMKLEKELEAPVKRGEKVGTVDVYVGGDIVETMDILTKDGTDRKVFFSYFKDIFNGWINILNV